MVLCGESSIVFERLFIYEEKPWYNFMLYVYNTVNL